MIITKKENRKIITIVMIIVLILVCILACFLIFKPKSNNNNNNVNNSSGELKELENDNMFAIYVQKAVDSTEYDEIESNSWPKGFIFNKGKSYCIDEDGNKITTNINLSYSSNRVYVSNISQTSYCFLYFNYESSGLTFYLNDGKNSVTSEREVTWQMNWTIPDPVSYCISTTNSSSSCTWTDFPPGVTTTYSSDIVLPDEEGPHIYYGFLKDSSGNIYNDDDTITYSPTIVPTDPEPSGSAPTCSISVSSTGIYLTKSSDTKEYGLTNSISVPTYNNKSNLSLEAGEFFGFVKNDAGTGTCRASVQTKVLQSGGGYYSFNVYQCSQTEAGSSTYNCCKAATSSSGSCPSGYSEINGYCAKDATNPTTCSTGTYDSSSKKCRSYTSITCPNGGSPLNGKCMTYSPIHGIPYSSKDECEKACTGGICGGSECYVCSDVNTKPSLLEGSGATCAQEFPSSCPSGYTKGTTQCYKDTGSPSCSSGKTLINGKCYTTTSKTGGGNKCSSSSDTLSGTQCCHTSSTQTSGYNCNVSSTTAPKYDWKSLSPGTSPVNMCSSAGACTSSNVGAYKYENCQYHSDSSAVYLCQDASYTSLNDQYCYKVY